MRLMLLILAQAIEDVLRYELGLPLVGADVNEEEFLYYDALRFISRYPTLMRKLEADKFKWLQEVQDAKLRCQSIC
jgi:hypothetical protein